jgi:Synergist-CTERM protein sorting domain-containing protein
MRRLAFVLLAACTTPTSATDQPIIGGTLDSGDTATVLLVSYPTNQSVQDNCSAVVISPTMLLTAAHCVDAATHPSYNYGVFVDADASAYPKLVDILPHLLPVAAVHPHPSYTTDEADIGIVELTSPLTITPMPVQRAALSATIANTAARIIGYGQTVNGTPNQVRYAATTVVVGTSGDDSVQVGDATAHACLGDSGGPAIVAGTVIGVDSHGPTGCTGPSFYRRTDTYAAFIDMYVPAPVTGTDAGNITGGAEAGTSDPTKSGGGGCSTTGSSSLVLLAVLPLLRRRRRV